MSATVVRYPGQYTELISKLKADIAQGRADAETLLPNIRWVHPSRAAWPRVDLGAVIMTGDSRPPAKRWGCQVSVSLQEGAGPLAKSRGTPLQHVKALWCTMLLLVSDFGFHLFCRMRSAALA
jgi:hypothetical protein